jgi:hypothetical protein
MKFLANLIRKIAAFFQSGKAEAALTQAAQLVPQALPIVQAIAALTPNKTVQEVEAAYARYAVPMSQQIGSDPSAIGNALLNLATTLLQKNLPASQAGAAINVLNTAVQLAVTGSKA